MTVSSTNYDLADLSKSVPEINLVATIKLTPQHFVQSHQLKFTSSCDDLDSLIFANLDLPSGNTISLVRHQNAPYSGTEIYIAPGLPNPSQVLAETIDTLNISRDDLDWIHPQVHFSQPV